MVQPKKNVFFFIWLALLLNKFSKHFVVYIIVSVVKIRLRQPKINLGNYKLIVKIEVYLIINN